MRIIERYILKHFIPSFLWCLGIFLFLYVIIDLFAHIDEIVREGVSFATLFYYYMTFAPFVIVQTSPIAILLATVYNLSSFNKNNEIVAMKASGINMWSVLRPILLMGILISVVTFLINDKIVPASVNISTRIKEERIEKKKVAPKKEITNVAIYGRKNRIIYARSFNPRMNELEDLVIHEHDNYQNLVSKINAPLARYSGGTWHLYNALVSRVNNQGQFIDDPKFYVQTTIDMEEKPEDFTKREWRTELMNYRQLSRYIELFKGGSPKAVNSLKVDLYHKISFPLISVIIILVGAPFALHLRRGGVLAGVGISIIVSLAYYAFTAIALAFGKANMLPPFVAAWLGNIVFGLYGFTQVHKLR